MLLHVESKEAQKTVVFLNGKPINHFIQAQDGEEGWVEVIDVEAMAPLYTPEDAANKNWQADTINEHDAGAEINSASEAEEEEWTPLKTKKIKGKVEFKRLG
jgi:hypothetical protein